MSDSKLDILRCLHTAAMKKRNDCEARRWKFELHGRQIILRDVAEKIIIGIDRFKQIGDIAVNFDPVHASLPWAGIRFLLEVRFRQNGKDQPMLMVKQMTVAESQQMGALLTGVEKLTLLISRCQIYENLYLNQEQPSAKDEWKPVVTNLTSTLVTLYATVLSFLASINRAYSRATLNRTIHAILNPAEVMGFLEKCQILEDEVAIEVDNCDRIHTRQTQARLNDKIQEHKQFLADLETPILRIDSRVAALCERLDSSERLSMLEWISGIRYEENHDFARQGRTIGTGEWLLHHERYREWRASSASMILWLHGVPGAGKSKLVSTVVDNLLKTFKQTPNDEAFAYFYCDRNQLDRQEPALILSSFVRQLSTSRNSDAIPHSTVQMYNQKRQTAFASGKLKMNESQTVLADLFQIYPQITLVVDALDECDKQTRSRFIDILDKLIAESSKPVKILISSRRDRDIEQRFEGGPNLAIRAIDSLADIAIFVNHEITESEKSWDFKIGSDLKELICNTLVEKSGGMFQWVALQIAAIRELCRERDIRNRLGKLPETLKDAYDELYRKTQLQKESTPMIADRAFQWVMCSCWPLSPTELVAAVCQNPDTDEIDEIDININVVLGACQNLLVVDKELNICRFSHLSVQEYFETHHWSACEADCLVGEVCLSLLINMKSTAPEQAAQLMMNKNKDSSPYDILEYAGFNWATHVQRLEEKGITDKHLTALLKHFLGSMNRSSLAYQNWHKTLKIYETQKGKAGHSKMPLPKVYYRLSPCSRASLAIVTFGFYKSILDWWALGFVDIIEQNSIGDSLLILGAMSGFCSIIEDLLKKGAEINAPSRGLFGTALQAAAPHESMVRLLLDKGADVNAPGGKYGNALQAASYFGSESVVQLLLDKGSDVNASGGNYGNALQAASISGSESVVQLLLDKGADVNASGGNFGNALHAASFIGSKLIVAMLLNKGADVNAMIGGRYSNALHVASRKGFESVVQMLLDKGANVNAMGIEHGNALQAASHAGSESVVQMLLDKGADVNASDGKFGNALYMASSRNSISVVQLLLDNGADFNATGGEFHSALQVASYGGYEFIVQLLLDNGADPNASGGVFGSALQAASVQNKETVVQMLLDKGADVNASGGECGCALRLASDESVVQLLLENGADVNAPGRRGHGSALAAASSQGLEWKVLLLLDKGADPNASDGTFGNALHAATASITGSKSVVQMLLDKGANVNATGGEYGSALQAASSHNLEWIVQLLLDNGADVNTMGGEYGNPLQAASNIGSKSVVQILLDMGADVNASCGMYGNALQAASYTGSESVVQMLLDSGADVNATGGMYGSALQAASSHNFKSIVQLLLDNGADVNATGGKYGSALRTASYGGFESVVQLLLDNGADVKALGEFYGSALQAASTNNHDTVVRLLQAAMKSEQKTLNQTSLSTSPLDSSKS